MMDNMYWSFYDYMMSIEIYPDDFDVHGSPKPYRTTIPYILKICKITDTNKYIIKKMSIDECNNIAILDTLHIIFDMMNYKIIIADSHFEKYLAYVYMKSNVNFSEIYIDNEDQMDNSSTTDNIIKHEFEENIEDAPTITAPIGELNDFDTKLKHMLSIPKPPKEIPADPDAKPKKRGKPKMDKN